MFTRRGYTVFAVRPGSQTRFSVHDMLENLNTGILWVKRHAGEYKIDPNQLGLTGASAGGHLACLASVTAQESTDGKPDTRVKATAVFFPPTDFLVYGGRPFDPQSFLFKTLALSRDPKKLKAVDDDEMKKLLTEISPARRVHSKVPPFLFIHGNADLMVPLQQSETMVEALKKENIPVELIVKQGGGHPWPTIHEEVKVIADWFDKQLASNASATTEPAPTAAGK
ncbi:MAG: prolyl oligopeptidase family serine peptidase [Planctomycetaceae bacterium]